MARVWVVREGDYWKEGSRLPADAATLVTKPPADQTRTAVLAGPADRLTRRPGPVRWSRSPPLRPFRPAGDRPTLPDHRNARRKRPFRARSHDPRDRRPHGRQAHSTVQRARRGARATGGNGGAAPAPSRRLVGPAPGPARPAQAALRSAPGNDQQHPTAIMRRLRHRPTPRPLAGHGEVHGARTAGKDGAPACGGPDAPPGRTAFAAQPPGGDAAAGQVPRPPSRPLAARRKPVLDSEREGVAATPPLGSRREASLPRAGSGQRGVHPAGRPARPHQCGRRINGWRAGRSGTAARSSLCGVLSPRT